MVDSGVEEVVVAAVERTVAENLRMSLKVVKGEENRTVTVTVEGDSGVESQLEGLTLHWAFETKGRPGDWTLPPKETWPVGSKEFGDGKSLRTACTVTDGKAVATVVVPEALVAGTDAIADTDSFDSDSDEEEEDGADDNLLVGIVLVLVRARPGAEDVWLHANDGSGDVSLQLTAEDTGTSKKRSGLAAKQLWQKAAKEEGQQGTNLFRRYCLVNEYLSEALDDIEGPEGAAVLFAWLRLSSSRLLPWYGGGNYQGKDMAHLQRALSCAMAYHAAKGGEKGHFCRLSLAGLPRGGGDGDAIRMGILHIMRDNGIKEGHRPGIEDHFIEQWHQKLHSNTTRDDIAICEAYLHFLHGSGNWDDFWWHLWEYNKLSRADLANMKAGWRSNGITGPANFMPQLIPAFQHLLWILKVTHSGADLDTAAQMARGSMSEGLQWDVDDLLRHRDEWWVPGKIVNIRQRLQEAWRNPDSRDSGKTRGVLLLDIALESFFRTKCEGMNLNTMSRDDVATVLDIALEGGAIAMDNETLNNALQLWKRVLYDSGGLERWSKDWALVADAALEYISLSLAETLGKIGALALPPATAIGKAAKVDPAYLSNFAEEVVRGHPLFVLSAMLAKLQPQVREIAGRSPWQVISSGSGETAGKVVVKALSEMQGIHITATEKYAEVLLSEDLGGLEDIPDGIVAVLTKSPVDLLSHIAIRARNARVLLACCEDSDRWEALLEKEGAFRKVVIDVNSGEVLLNDSTEAEAALGSSDVSEKLRNLQIPKPATTTRWVFQPAEYNSSVLGGKSNSLRVLASQAAELGEDVVVPGSLALPFGTFERILALADSEDKMSFDEALAMIDPSGNDPAAVRKALAKVREVVMKFKLPEGLTRDVAAVARVQGGKISALDTSLDATARSKKGQIADSGVEEWRAIKKVWASKWTERAFLSRRSCGISEDQLFMAVLCMDVVPAEYAFVLHTKHPLTDSESEMVGQVVVGLGESLVGNLAGRPMTFVANKTTGDIVSCTLPSKLVAYYAPDGGSMIARSDSNGEDLEGFAGAGLYDSILAHHTVMRPLNYAHERLTWDAAFREYLMKRLVAVANKVEKVTGNAQDVEGCFYKDKLYLLQSRAQV